jgi:hypothetical protein
LQGAEIGKDFYILDVEEELKQEHHEAAERQFISKAGPSLFEPVTLKQISNELGPLLFEFVNENLTHTQKVNDFRLIRRVLGNDLRTCNNLLGAGADLKSFCVAGFFVLVRFMDFI